MISMKLDKKAREEIFEKQDYALSDTPEYPYNLKIWLEDEQIKKLGLQDCAVGDEKIAAIKVKVESTSINQRDGGEKCYSVCLQITDMQFKKPEKKAEETFYGE